MYFDKPTQTMPREELDQLQLRKLQAMLGEIYDKNPLYTRKLKAVGFQPGDLKTLADLKHLPFTRKAEFSAAQEEDGFACNLTYPITVYTRLHQTSGTTGKPLRVFDTVDSWDWWARCWGHVFAGAGVTAADRIFSAFNFGPFIGFWAAVDGAKKIGALLVPGGGRSSIERLQLMKETGCTVLCSTPSYALHLIEVAREHDFDLSELNIHTTIHAGEPGANIPAIKQRLEAAWGAKCYDHSGASEVGAYGFESTERRNGLQIIESEFIAEVIKPGTEEPAAPGASGELVLTNLGRLGFPLIRYHSGDIVQPANATHDDSCFMFLDNGVIGRADDMITVRGVNIYPSAIDNLVRHFEAISEYRATVSKQGELDELTIEIEVQRHADSAAMQEALRERIKLTLGLRVIIELAQPQTLPRFEHKARRLHVQK